MISDAHLSTDSTTLWQILTKEYVHARPRLGKESFKQMQAIVQSLDRFHGSPVKLDDLWPESVEARRSRVRTGRYVFRDWLRDAEKKRAPRTVKNYRDIILCIWRFAYEEGFCNHQPGRTKRFPVVQIPRRVPIGCTMGELRSMLRQCDQVVPRRGWTGLHWKALIMVLFDTALRVGTLLDLRREVYWRPQRKLFCTAEVMKGNTDKVCDLRIETCTVIDSMLCVDATLKSEFLFPFPWKKKHIQRHFRRDILIPAGLPHGRRDLFHKIRRTSYSHVYAKLGPRAASEHAAHTSDLSRFYLDPTILEGPRPIDVLPRLA